MIFEILDRLRGLENLCLCSQITLKVIVSRTTGARMDLNQRRNLIKHFFYIKSDHSLPISMIFEILALLGCLENLCLCSQVSLRQVISRTAGTLMDLNWHMNLTTQLFTLDQIPLKSFQ